MRLSVLVVVALVATVATAIDFENPRGYTYEQYLTDFEKMYTPEELEVHRAIFERKVATILAHNADPTQTWKAGVNQFTDLSSEEMTAYFGYNAAAARQRRVTTPPATHTTSIPVSSLPTAVDWRDKGIISPVKNQGGCGSCWAFAATESIETTVMQDTGRLLVLSTQNVVSCAPNPHHCGGTGGCGGSTAELAFEYVQSKGIASESAYPYRAQTGTCNESIPKSAKIKSFVKLIENNYTDVIVALATVGPLAVNVDANSWSIYSSGVFTGCQFRDIDINHVVQAVGYGTDSARGDYWIIRNSWGAGWGEKGYMRLQRHSDGDHSKWCGPDTQPQDGTGCDGGPAEVTACGSCGVWYDASYPTGGSVV